MNMAFTSDNRPHTIGDMIVITGTVANGDTEADLSDFLSEILMGTVSPLGGVGAPHGATIDGTTLKFTDPANAAGGRLFVVGKR